MKFRSWNVNGIRAAWGKGFLHWFEDQNADFVALQETKAQVADLDESVIHPKGYGSVWHSAEKKGYSGVAVYYKKEPQAVIHGLGHSEFDCEGRVLQLEYQDFFLMNAYFPNSQRDHARLDYKLKFCNAMQKRCGEIVATGKHVILCGDYNIAHQEIDLKNPKSNQNNAGFLPEERQWMTSFLASGMNDVFRKHWPEPDHYTWWSYRPGVREKNIGWRLDYHCVDDAFVERVKRVEHQPEVSGSDHCPTLLETRDA